MDIVWAFRRAVSRHPDRRFLFDSDAAITYQGADRLSDEAAVAYIEAGLHLGDTVALCSPDSIALIVAIIGAWKAGLLPGLIDARTSDANLPYFVKDVGSKLVVAPKMLHRRLGAAGANAVADIASFHATGRRGDLHHGPAAPLYLSYTSGTTGTPKGAILQSGPVTIGTSCVADRLGITKDDVVLATTPTASSFQLVAALMPSIHVGASVGLVAGLTADQIWETATTHRASVLVAYPLTLADMVNHPAAMKATPFRLALSGGSPLAPRIKRDYGDRLGIPLLESYGQSELGGFMAMGSMADGERALEGFVGRPLPDRPAYVADADGREVPSGHVGEVIVPFGCFRQYINKPEATDKAMAGGVLHTGDLAIADADGYLKVLGRTVERKHAAQRGGFLRELEDAYYEHPGVKHAAVVECGDGEVEAFVELLRGHIVDAHELGEMATAIVGRRVIPRNTTILETMPRTFSGKANRQFLSEACLQQSGPVP